MSLGQRRDLDKGVLALRGRRVDEVIVHHSVSRSSTTAEEIDRWHRARGFNGPGYHFLVREYESGKWEVVDLRDEALEGAHAPGHNEHSLGVCIAGDYTKVELSQGAKDVLFAVLSWICRQLDLSPDQVKGHREVERPGYTECPGFDMTMVRAGVERELS